MQRRCIRTFIVSVPSLFDGQTSEMPKAKTPRRDVVSESKLWKYQQLFISFPFLTQRATVKQTTWRLNIRNLVLHLSSGQESFSASLMTPIKARPSVDEQRIIDFRNVTNFRSVTRNDPFILEIIETSVYSVVYHYDESAGAWEKQKLEGSMFVVRR